MWRDYFLGAHIHGIDVSPCPFDPVPERIVFHHINVLDTVSMDAELRDLKFDLIIDDGSHILLEQIAALKYLWPRLTETGIYCIEDIARADDMDKLVPAGAGATFYDFTWMSKRYDDRMVVLIK